ncbi:18515_t:CDS:1, partial [Gigaspora rosea]
IEDAVINNKFIFVTLVSIMHNNYKTSNSGRYPSSFFTFIAFSILSKTKTQPWSSLWLTSFNET